MDKELTAFLSEGMRNYKKASFIMQRFFNNTQSTLQNILKQRREWGAFVPGEVRKVKSTKYWDAYPLINAQIGGKVGKVPTTIEIAINWFQSETDYPFYAIGFYEPVYFNETKLSSYKQTGKVKYLNNGLKLFPDPADFNLDRDFNLLITELLKTLNP